MIRLTLVLIAAIGVTLSIAGQDPNLDQGSDAGLTVARADTDLNTSGVLALDDEAGAIARAIQATDTFRASDVAALVKEVSLVSKASASTAPVTTDLAAASTASTELAIVNAARVNLRAGPSTANPVLDQVQRDQQVQVVERSADGWSRIRVLDSGTTAWIFDRFLTPQG